MSRTTTSGLNLSKMLPLLAVFAALILGAAQEGYGQDTRRVYANFQGVFERGTGALSIPVLVGEVQNPLNAINKTGHGNLANHSTLNVPIGALDLVETTQFLAFTNDGTLNTVRQLPAEKSVTIKFSLPKELLGLLSSVKIGTFTNLSARSRNWPLLVSIGTGHNAGHNSEDRTESLSAESLLNLLNGAGEFEVTLTPTTPYNGIYLSLTSVLSLGLSANLFHAYIMEESSEPLDCDERNKAIDVLSGTRSNEIGALTSLGGVANPYNVTNGNIYEYATMNVGVGALNTVYLNTIFPTASPLDQRVRIVLDDPGGLLNSGLLSSFTIQPMLRHQDSGPPLEINNPLLNIRLLPGSTKYELAYTIHDPFDRIELRFDNTLTALTSLKVYEVSRSARIILIEDSIVLTDTLTSCGQVDLTNAIANYQPDHYTYNFYTAPAGGTALSSSIVTASGNFYIEAVDPATGCATERVQVTATVTPPPTIDLSSILSICEGDTNTSLEFSNVTNADNYSIIWNDDVLALANVPETELPINGVIELSDLSSVPKGTYTGTFRIHNSTTGCESEKTITLTVTAKPGRPNITNITGN